MVEPRLVTSGPIWERLMGRTTDIEAGRPPAWTFFLVAPDRGRLKYLEVRILFDPSMSPAERFHHTAKMAVEAAFRFVAAPDGGGPCYLDAPDLVEAWLGKASPLPRQPSWPEALSRRLRDAPAHRPGTSCCRMYKTA